MGSVDSSNAENVDKLVHSFLMSMHREAVDADKTVVMHLVVEEEQGAARRRRMARRLNEDENEDRNDEEDQERNDEEDQEREDGGEGNNNARQYSSGYYGYGYYDAYGNWVSHV